MSETPTVTLLSTVNHDRDSAGLRYVYPVVSRRAGGVSLGVNLNPNNACNWACVYCQVPNLTRGGPPPLDLGLLKTELNTMLDDIQHGSFMQRAVPEDVRHLVDVAFSGNGEPTSAPEFAEAVELVANVLAERGLQSLKLRLITNGSLVHQASVQAGLRLLAKHQGEVWFKFDAASAERVALINGVNHQPSLALQRLKLCAGIVPTWVQTCLFALDGRAPAEAELQRYIELISEVKNEVQGVLLYGLARPSMQPAAPRLSAVSEAWLKQVAQQLEQAGVTVKLSV